MEAIKSEILEIKDFVKSSFNHSSPEVLDLNNSDDNSLSFNQENTLTLTKVVSSDSKKLNINYIEEIKEELNFIKTILDKHEKILNEILLKLK
jgi:hypothetical protein